MKNYVKNWTTKEVKQSLDEFNDVLIRLCFSNVLIFS